MRSPKFAQHIRSLCRRNKIRVRYSHRGQVDFDTRTIRIRPVRSHVTYIIALHEVGHLLSRSQSRPRLEQETLAWQWARKHALCWNPTMERTLRRGLQSYLRSALQDQNVLDSVGLLRLPPRDHAFWRLLPTQLPKTPSWLDQGLASIPWARILSHPDRPRCENCAFWTPHMSYERANVREKLTVGECRNKNKPLGMELTPGGALCGSSWIRKP